MTRARWMGVLSIVALMGCSITPSADPGDQGADGDDLSEGIDIALPSESTGDPSMPLAVRIHTPRVPHATER